MLTSSTVVRADGGGVAEELFREGKTLMAEGRVAEGCTKLEESQRLDPGSGTLVNLALCYEKLGQLARAWAEFGKVPSLARRDGRPDREDFARSHISDIESRLSWLTIVVRSAAEAPGLEVSLDGTTLRRGVWNTALPIDPGKHHVVVTATGRVPWNVEIASGPTRQELVVPALPKLDLPLAEMAPLASNHTSPNGHDAAGWRTVGFVVGGIGGAALAAGAVFGILAITTNHEASDACHGGTSCPPGSPGPSESRRAIVDATMADVGVGLGVAAGATALYLILSNGEPSSPSSGAATYGIHVGEHLEPRGGGLTFTSSW